jgi:hypothetical protein
MAKKARPTGKPKLPDSTFADQVDELVHCELNDKPLNDKQRRYGRRERQLASAFALLHRLLERHRRELTDDAPLDLDKSGLIPALRVLDEPKSGKGDLIWHYIEDVRVARRESNRPPAGDAVEALQAILVGLVEAYAELANVKMTKATKEMVEQCHLEEIPITADMIKAWTKNFRDTKSELPKNMARREFLAWARNSDRPALERLIARITDWAPKAWRLVR